MDASHQPSSSDDICPICRDHPKDIFLSSCGHAFCGTRCGSVVRSTCMPCMHAHFNLLCLQQQQLRWHHEALKARAHTPPSCIMSEECVFALAAGRCICSYLHRAVAGIHAKAGQSCPVCRQQVSQQMEHAAATAACRAHPWPVFHECLCACPPCFFTLHLPGWVRDRTCKWSCKSIVLTVCMQIRTCSTTGANTGWDVIELQLGKVLLQVDLPTRNGTPAAQLDRICKLFDVKANRYF